jgi:hypothetical protein
MVIGTMVPDWPLYVPFGPEYDITHSLGGLFYACLPLGLALAVFFQLALKRPMLELLPVYLRERLVRFLAQPTGLSASVLLTMSIAVLAGAATHVLWDSFTHRGTWAVQSFPALNEVALTIGSLRFRTYMALQHGSTLVGFPLFLLLAWWWCRKAEKQPSPLPEMSARAILFWRVLLLAIPAVFGVHIVWQLFDVSSTRSIFRVLYFGVTRCGLLLMIALFVLGALYRLGIQPRLLNASRDRRRSG